MAAGKFGVSTSQMKTTIAQLTEANNQFKNRVNDLKNTESELAGMWQGDANTAFRQAFAQDSTKWNEFNRLITQYIATLQKIMNTYDQAESKNTSTAKTRSY